MRSYEIYKVKKRYQSFIIGREQLLYDLLKEHVDDGDNSPEVHYLCDLLETELINEAILSNLGKVFTTIDGDPGHYTLTHPVKGSIQISVSDYTLNVNCNGSRMLDLDLFVALSGADDRFFAVMGSQGEWGWLKPVKYTDVHPAKESVFL